MRPLQGAGRAAVTTGGSGRAGLQTDFAMGGRRLDRRHRPRRLHTLPDRRRTDRRQAGAGSARPPEGPVHALLRRDVGALLLLRHARPADPLSDHALDVRRRQVQPDLRRLSQPRLHHPGARRLSRRSLARAAQGGAVRRHPADDRPQPDGGRGSRRPGRPDDQRLLGRSRLHHRRLGLPQGQHIGDGRAALPAHRHSPRSGLHHLLHGH